MYKKIMLVALASIISFGLAGCVPQEMTPSSDTQTQAKQELAQREMTRQVDIPAIVNWQEKKLLKSLYELRDQADLVRYAYYFNTMTGENGAFIGKCVGYGMPASAQFSSPKKLIDAEKVIGRLYEDNGTAQQMPQAEPNGVFMPEGLSATYLMLINPITGEVDAAYIESEINVYPWPLRPEDK